MKKPGQSTETWDTFWFWSVPPHSLAAFRILFGIYLLVYFLRFALHVESLFSDQGVYAPFFLPDLGLPVAWAWMLYVCTILTIMSFLVGFKTRWVTPLLLGLYFYYFCLNLATNDTAYDRLNLIMLFILCFARLDGVWSIGKSRNSPSGQTDLVSIWAIRLLTIQIALLYFGAGLWKLIAPSWHTGDMLHMTLIGQWGTPLAFSLVRLNLPPVFYDTLTWSIVVFELTVPFALFSKKLQALAFLIGFLFHLSIACLLHIPEFMNCVCAYVLFIDPAILQRHSNSIVSKIIKGLPNRLPGP